MQTSGGTAGYHATFPFRPVGSYCDPVVRVHGYTEPKLNWTQHTTVILGASTAAAWLKRPIEKLHAFYFLCDVPGDSSRIYASDKRAHFFRTLFGVRWFAGPSILWTLAEYAFQLVAFTQLRDSLPFGGNTIRGFVAGGLTGAICTAFCHPYHVLRATAEAEKSMGFLGASDVFRRAITERPAVLLDIYRGAAVASCGQMFLLGSTFGFYNATRYDGVYHHSGALFVYCHLGVFLGKLLQYPFLSVKQQLHMQNRLTRGRPHTVRSYVMDVRRRHGITKVYDGFFASHPILNSIPPALLLVMYDICARRWTEQLHPELRKVHGEVDQPLCSVRRATNAKTPPMYEFKHS